MEIGNSGSPRRQADQFLRALGSALECPSSKPTEPSRGDVLRVWVRYAGDASQHVLTGEKGDCYTKFPSYAYDAGATYRCAGSGVPLLKAAS